MSQPSYSSAVGYISEQFFTMSFDVALDAANPPLIGAFHVQVNGTDVTVTNVAVDSAAQTVTLGINGFLLAGDIIDYVYTDPTVGNDVSAIQGTDGADAASFNHSIVVAIGRPGPSAPSTPALASGSDTGTVGDGITSVTTPTVTGTASANALVQLYDDKGSTLLGSTTADGSGNWSITSSTLSDGTHVLTAVQTDNSKVSSLPSAGYTVTIDTVALPPSTLTVAAGSDSGTLGDGISNVGTPQITGKAESKASVTLYDTDGSTVIGSTTADGSGNWSITTTTLIEGTHTLSATQTDAAGNASKASSGFSYTVDTIGPVGMALSQTTVNQSAATNGSTVATLSSTDLSTVSYGFQTGNGVIDADNGKFTISGGNLVAAQNLTAGTYHIYLKATDAASNEAFQFFSIDVTNAPGVSSIVRAGAAAGTTPASTTSVDYTVTFNQAVTGVDISDFALTTTGSASGNISAIAGSGDTYTITVDNVSGTGDLRLDLNSSATGIQNAAAVAISGGYSAGQSYTLDHTTPLAPSAPAMTAGTDTGPSNSDAITSNTTPTFTGVAEANAAITLYDTDGTTVLGSTTADGSGNWSITSGTLSEGSHSVKIKQTDAAGNASTAGAALAVVIDTTVAAPAMPVLAPVSDSGTLGDGITNTATPTITGTAEANATVKLYDTDGTTLLGTTTANGAGAWSIVASTLIDGAHTLTVKQTDKAGNVSTASAALTLTIDTLAPAAPATPVLAASSDSGALGDNLTNISAPTFTGTGAANAKVTLYDTDGVTVLGTTTADGAGNWTIASSELSLGAHTLSVKQTDAAGNQSGASEPLSLTIEQPPAPTGTTVDGVQVVQQPATLPGGGSGTQTVIPIVTSDRTESNGSASVADIPLAVSGTSNLLLAQLPAGFGLTSTGGDSLPAANSLDRLIQSILAATPDHSASDQGHLTGNGTTFLNELVATTPLLVQTIVAVSSATAPGAPLTLTGTSTDAQHTALVIDATQLAAGSQLVLNQVDFAAIIGAATVTGNTNGQILTGDVAGQQFVVSAASDSNVFAGGGNDTLVLTPAAATASGARVQAAAQAGTTILHGGLGADSATFSGAAADYTVETHDGYLLVTAAAQPAQHALVVNVETLKFSDTSITVQNDAAMDSLAGLYQTVLGRQADYLGIDFWTQSTKLGVSLGQVAIDMISSAESQSLHPMVFNGDSAHDIELLYQGIFGRAGDADGVAYWVEQVANGAALADVAQQFMLSDESAAHKIAAQNWDFLVA